MLSDRSCEPHHTLPTGPCAPLYDTLEETTSAGQEGAAERDEQEEQASILREAYRIADIRRVLVWISQRR